MTLTLRNVFPLFLLLLIASCATKKDIVYFQNNEAVGGAGSSQYEPVIQPDDLLYIFITAEDQEVAAPFNLSTTAGISSTATSMGNQSGGMMQYTYLVDNAGEIEFPVIGKIKVAGYTRSAMLTMFKEKLRTYIVNPGVSFRIVNYKFTVLGEVTAPGTYNVQSERITLPEALGMAGDLTIYGHRHNILVIRDDMGKKTFTRVNITQADFVNSPFYYLDQNDVVYVEPNPTKVRGASIGPNITLVFSITSFLITILTLLSLN